MSWIADGHLGGKLSTKWQISMLVPWVNIIQPSESKIVPKRGEQLWCDLWIQDTQAFAGLLQHCTTSKSCGLDHSVVNCVLLICQKWPDSDAGTVTTDVWFCLARSGTLLLNCGWNVNIITVSSGAVMQLFSALQTSNLLRAVFCCLALGTFQGRAGSMGLSLKVAFWLKMLPEI